MAVLSILEWGVYGFFAYSSMLMLIISTIKEIPMTKSLSIARCIYLIPGIICSFIIAVSGDKIIFNTLTTTSLNTTEVWVENNVLTLQDPVWLLVHMMIGIVLVVYVITQVLVLFTKYDEADRAYQ